MGKTRQSSKRTAHDADLSTQDSSILSDSDLYNRISQLLDRKLSKQTEKIDAQVSQLFTLLRDGEIRIMEKLNSSIKDIENKFLTELGKRICEFNKDLSEITERVSALEIVMGEVSHLKEEIKKLKIQSIKHSNSIVACDLRINCVPFSPDEDLYKLFDIICTTLQISTPKLQSIHRLQTRNNKIKENSPDGVIIAKLMSPNDKNFLLKEETKWKFNPRSSWFSP